MAWEWGWTSVSCAEPRKGKVLPKANNQRTVQRKIIMQWASLLVEVQGE